MQANTMTEQMQSYKDAIRTFIDIHGIEGGIDCPVELDGNDVFGCPAVYENHIIDDTMVVRLIVVDPGEGYTYEIIANCYDTRTKKSFEMPISVLNRYNVEKIIGKLFR